MKRIISIIFILLLVVFNNKDSLNGYNIYFIYQNDCLKCNQELAWLKDINKRFAFNLVILNINKDEQIINKLKKELNIKKLGVPSVILNKEYMEGYSNEIKEHILEKLESDFSNCEMVFKGNEEKELLNCLPKSENVINKNNFWLKIFEAAGIIMGVTFSVVFMIKKYRRIK